MLFECDKSIFQIHEFISSANVHYKVKIQNLSYLTDFKEIPSSVEFVMNVQVYGKYQGYGILGRAVDSLFAVSMGDVMAFSDLHHLRFCL